VLFLVEVEAGHGNGDERMRVRVGSNGEIVRNLAYGSGLLPSWLMAACFQEDCG
jgi:hypothetical protein